MSRKIFDITRPLSPALAVWPGDTPFSTAATMAISAGETVNVTTLTLSSHTGTHVDAAYHFSQNGLTLDRTPLEPFIGPATVVTAPRAAGPLTPDDFPGLDWSKVSRLLVHSQASNHPLERFPAEFVYPSPELANLMGRHGVVLFGSDAPSMDDMNSHTLPGHHALHRNGIAILEGLLLAGVPDGEYELVALPLKITGGDGSPVRAILRG